MKRLWHLDYLVACLAGLAALALYARTAAPGVLGGDSGEFQFAAWVAGLVHPTGYPLYLILGYAWTHVLPWGDPAARLNLLSAVFGGLAVGLTYLLALRSLQLAGPAHQPAWTYRLLALVGAAVFAGSATFWSQAVVAEVYALQAALLAALLLSLVTWAARPAPGRPLYAAAALLGLALAHHRSVILLLPAALLFLAQTGRRSAMPHPWRKWLVRSVPLALAPLLLYAYIPLRAPYTPYLRIDLAPGDVLHLYDPTPAGFLAYLSGETFAGAFRSTLEIPAQVGAAARLLAHEMTWPGIGLGILGIIWLTRARNRPLLTLTGVSFLGVVAFNLFYGIGDIYVYYIPAYLIWSLWIALGVAGGAALLARLAGRVRRMPRPVQARLPAPPWLLGLAAVVALALPLWLLSSNYARADRSRDHSAEAEWAARLAQPIPAGAVLVTNDRDEMMPLWYLQVVNGMRRDLIGLFPLILPAPQWADVGRVTEQALLSGRNVYLVKPMPGLETKFRLAPAGSLVQVEGPAVTRGPQQESHLDFAGALRLVGYDLQPPRLDQTRTVTVTLYWQPLRQLQANYTSYAHLVSAGGTLVGQDDHRPGGEYYPSKLWQPGELIRDAHIVRLPDAGQNRPPYNIVVGLYTRRGTELISLGEPQTVGQLP